MEREIKFRGKCNGRWLYGSLCSDPYNDIIEISDHEEINLGRYEVDPRTVGQFTGLNDKNGKDIYEGDIVKLAYDGLCYVVAFRRGMFYASAHELNEYVYGGYPLWKICEDNGLCEIIGNIHDNPSMLRKS